MSGPILKYEPKKSQNERLKEALTASEEQLAAVVNNESITRRRVESLERVLGGFLGLSFKHRLRWLIFGMPLPPKPVAPETQTPQTVEAPDVEH